MSFAPTYACFGCVDFANNARTKAYVAWACRTGRYKGDAPPMNWLCTCPADCPEVVLASWIGADDQIAWNFPTELAEAPAYVVFHGPDGLIPPATPVTIEGTGLSAGDPGVTSTTTSFTIDDFLATFVGSLSALLEFTGADFYNAADELLYSWVGPLSVDVTINDEDVSGAGDCFDNPIDDQVCWYDPQIPESADFLGVVVYGSSNVRSSSFSREISAGLNGGSVLGQPIIAGKQLMLEVWLYATSQAGMDYGIQWLRRQFEGDQRCPSDGATCASCQGQLLTIRTHCPDGSALDDGLHSWAAAGTIDGFQPIDDEFPMGRRNCEKITTGTITIATESFSSYSTNPYSSAEVDISSAFTALGNCLLESDLPTLDDVCCPICSIGCDPCTTDPACDCLPPFVLTPEVVSNFAPCFTDPVCRCVAAIAVENLPAGYETALRMTLRSGWDPTNPIFQRYGMRNFVFRVFENSSTETDPFGLPLPTDLESYEYMIDRLGPCAEVGVSWMPAGSELVVDGLSGQTWLKCNGKCVDHSGRVETISGSIFPLKARCTNLVITVEWDCLNSQSRVAAETILSSLLVETFLGFNL